MYVHSPSPGASSSSTQPAALQQGSDTEDDGKTLAKQDTACNSDVLVTNSVCPWRGPDLSSHRLGPEIQDCSA